jgi:1,4-dihydroxy-6-naphthoate synthase
MQLSLGFSPCPNDTFIFDALVNGKIDTGGLSFDVGYHDVETLNQKAFNHELDITKLSYHAFAYAVEDYELLDAGSALGFGVGPLLITKNEALAEELRQYAGGLLPERLQNLKIGIPGKYTTANFLLSLAYPLLQNKRQLLFSDTYAAKGLHKVVDLGDYWEKTTTSPIPLGGIVIRRNLPDDIKQQINTLVQESVEFAFANPKSGLDYIRSHAQEMDENVMYKHIELYVNKYSLNLGVEGRRAIQAMFDRALQLHLIPETAKSVFLT